MKRSWPLLLWLVVVWVALWEELTWANVIGGLLAGTALLTLFPTRDTERRGRIRPIAAGRFLAYFLWKLVEASAVVSWEVLTPRNRINEGIVAVPIRGGSDALVTAVANAISLVPGTLTLEIDRDPTVLYVHVLHLRDIEDVRLEVQHLELLAIRAFGPDELVRAVGEADGGAPRSHRPPRAGSRHR